MKKGLCLFFILVCLLLVTGCSPASERGSGQNSAATDTAALVPPNEADFDETNARCRRTVGIYDYKTIDYTDETPTLGQATVTFPFNESVSDLYGIEILKVVSCSDFGTPLEDIFHRTYWGAAPVYRISKQEFLRLENGLYGSRFLHGMSEEELKHDSNEIKEDYLNRREYMYALSVNNDDLYLILTFRPSDRLPVTENEHEAFTDIVGSLTVEIQSDPAFLDSLKKAFVSELADGENLSLYNAESNKIGLLSVPTEVSALRESVTDALAVDSWVEAQYEPDAGDPLFRLSTWNFILSVRKDGLLTLSDGRSASDGRVIYFKAAVNVADALSSFFSGVETKILSFRPNTDAEFLFSSNRQSDGQYFLFFEENGNTTVYRTGDFGESFSPCTITGTPSGVKSVKALYATHGGAADHLGVVSELTYENEIEYAYYNLKEEDGVYSFVYESPIDSGMMLGYQWPIEGIRYPSKNLPFSTDNLISADQLGLEEHDSRYRFLQAFVDGDSDALEAFCAPSLPKGSYGAVSDLVFETYTAYRIGDDIGFNVILSKSDIDSLPVGISLRFAVYEGINGTHLSGGANEPYIHLQVRDTIDLYLDCSYAYDIPESNEMEDTFRWSITEYLCARRGNTRPDGVTAMSEVQLIADAETYLGIHNFTPDDFHRRGDGSYDILPHGGHGIVYNILSAEPSASGIGMTVIVQFYADASKFVKSHTYRYELELTDEGQFAFTDCVKISESVYEPLRWAV